MVLDLIQDQFPKVEIEPPSNETGQWFVQVYRNDADTPEGFFGDSSLESALRLAKALKLTTS